MKTTEISIINGLTMAQTNLMNVNELTDEALTSLISLASILGAWLEAATNEAVSRARDGVCYDGYTLKESTRRKISDPEGALDAVRSFDPSLLPLCQKTELVSFKELTKRLGKSRFEELFGPFMTQSSSYRLVPEEE